MHENDIAKDIVDVAYKVHTRLGLGLFEIVYEAILAYELDKRGHDVLRQKALPVCYEGLTFDEGFRVDLIVDDRVLIEVKSVEQTLPVHKKQLLTYLKLMDKRLGLLINFGEAYIKDGITRLVNGLEE